MKFQNSSIHGFKVMLCIKKRDERTDGRKDGRTNNPEAICPSNFFEVGGIKSSHALFTLAKLLTPDFQAFAGFQTYRAWLFLDFRHLDFDFSMYMLFKRTI